MVRAGVLTFGDFTTKSGRKTPYFINTGNYQTGEQAARLGEFYAQCILHSGARCDVLYGPAYKGIPLAVATAIALHGQGVEVRYCFNRKEAKDHGEGGTLIGCRPQDGQEVLIVEDVITAGTSVRESVPLLSAAAKVKVRGLVVSVDRMERGRGSKSALQEIRDEFGMETYAIVTVRDIMRQLHNRPVDGKIYLDDAAYARMVAYLKEYGTQEACADV